MKMMTKLTLSIFCLVFTCQLLAQTTRKQQACVIENGILKSVEFDYNRSTGDSTVTINGKVKRFSEVYPPEGPEYAGKKSWYINNEGISVNGVYYVKFGLPRVLNTTDVVKYGTYKEVPVFAEQGSGKAEVIYVPIRNGCEFQPYQRDVTPCKIGIQINPKITTVTAGKEIVLTATIAPGKFKNLSYEWGVTKIDANEDIYNGDDLIIGSKKGTSVKISTKGQKGNHLSIGITVTPADGACNGANKSIEILVK